MEADRIRELLAGWDEDRLSEAEESELAATLKGSAEARRILVAEFMLTGGLVRELRRERAGKAASGRIMTVDAGREAAPPECRPPSRTALPPTGLSSRRRRQRSTRRAVGLPFLAAAAALLLAVGAYMLLGRRKTPSAWQAEISRLAGTVELVRESKSSAAGLGTALRPGDRLNTRDGARLTVRYGDGTTVEMNELTTLMLGASSAERLPHLERGDIYVIAAGPVTVNRGEYDEVSVLGTEFELSRAEGQTVLRVAAGNVKFGRTASVGPLQASEATAGGTPGAPGAIELSAIAPWRDPLTVDLAGWWKFDDGSGDVAHDSSSRGNHGRISGATWTDGRFGRGLLFDGKGQVKVPWSRSLGATKGVTVAAWVRTMEKDKAVAQDIPHLVIGQSASARNYRFSVDKRFVFFMSHSWEGQEGSPSKAPRSARVDGHAWPDDWVHVAFTVSTDGGGRYACYVNGEAIESLGPQDVDGVRRFDRLVPAPDEALQIGSVYGFHVAVDEIRIYTRALSADEIARAAKEGVQ